mmetsp:Transcript_105/g.299  ORF Transcript_105/g.299 Transcript_105/m.299 type:complete len:1955 (-) Transcript_105:308-6172(-)
MQQSDDVCVVHVKAGSEYQALLYLLRSVSRHYELDDVLPEPPEDIATHRYVVLRGPRDHCPEGDAYSCFQAASLPPGFLLTRVPLSYLTPAKAPHNWGVEGQDDAVSHTPGSQDATGSETGDTEQPVSLPAVIAEASPNLSEPPFSTAGDSLGAVGDSTDSGSATASEGMYGLLQRATMPRAPPVAPTALPIFQFLFGDDAEPWMQAAAAGTVEDTPEQEDGEYRGPAGGQPLGPKHWSEIRLEGMRRMKHPVSQEQAAALNRQIRERISKHTGAPLHVLVPVAMPNNPSYLRMAAEAIVAFNRRGLMLTPYLDSTCVPVAAITLIQSFWRGYRVRQGLGIEVKIMELRAAMIIQRKWRAYLLRQRLRMLHQMHVLATSLGDLLMAGQLALSVASCSVLRDRMAREEDSLFPEHTKRFAFDKKGQVYMVVSEGDERPGLPLWVSSLVHTKTEAEVGMKTALGQKDVLQLLTTATVWKDPQGNEVPKSNGLPDPPNGSRGSDILLQVSFASVLEARARACLLLALTYDPRLSQGAMLMPLNATDIAQRLDLPNSRASTPFGTWGSLMMHRWSSVHSHLASRLHSPSLDSEWVHSQIGSLPASTGSTMRPLTGTSPPGSPQRPLTREAHSCEGALSRGSLRESAASRQSHTRRSSTVPRLSASELTDLARSELHERERTSPPPRNPRVRSPMRTPPTPGSRPRHVSSSFSLRGSFSRLPPLYQQRPASEQGPPGASSRRSPARSTYPLHLASEVHPLEFVQATQEQPISIDAQEAELEASKEQQHTLVQDQAAQQQGGLEQVQQQEVEEQERRNKLQQLAQQEQEDLQRMDYELEQKQRQQWARLQELKQQQSNVKQQQQQHMDGKQGPAQEGPPKSPSAMTRSRSPGLGTSPLIEMYTVPEERQESDAEAEEIRLRMEMDARILMLSESAKARLERDQLVHMHEDGPFPTSTDGVATPDTRPPLPTTAPGPEAESAARAAPAAQDASQVSSSFQPMTQTGAYVPLHQPPRSLQAILTYELQQHQKQQRQQLLQPMSNRKASTFPRGRQATGGPHAPPHTEGPQQISPHTNTTNTEAVQWEALPGVFSRKRTGLPGSKSAAALLQELQRKAELLQDMQATQPEVTMGLTIEKATIGSVDVTELLEAVKLTQAALLREEGLRIQQEAYRRREAAMEEEVRKGREKAATELLWMKHTSTSHNLAPGYMPLSSVAMARLVAEMRAVYRAAAMEQVAEARRDHKEAMEEVHEDKERFQQTTNVVGRRQAEVLSTLRQVYEERWDKAAEGRQTCRAMAEERHSRRKHERKFAQAFSRQANLLARTVRRGESNVKHTSEAAYMYQQAQELRMADEARQASITQNKIDVEALNYHKAAAIRTWEKEQVATMRLTASLGNDVVQQRRQEGTARKARLGGATGGGVWGSALPREVLRQPLPLSSVVSAAAARRHQKQQRQQQQEQRPAVHAPWTQGQAGSAAPAAGTQKQQQQQQLQEEGELQGQHSSGGLGAIEESVAGEQSRPAVGVRRASPSSKGGIQPALAAGTPTMTMLDLDKLLDADIRPNSAKGSSRQGSHRNRLPSPTAAASPHRGSQPANSANPNANSAAGRSREGSPAGASRAMCRSGSFPLEAGTAAATPNPDALRREGSISTCYYSSKPSSVTHGASGSVPPLLPPLPGAAARPSSGPLPRTTTRPDSGGQPSPHTHHHQHVHHLRREGAPSPAHTSVPPRSPSARYAARARSAAAASAANPVTGRDAVPAEYPSGAPQSRLQSAASGTYTCSSCYTGSSYFSGSEGGDSWSDSDGSGGEESGFNDGWEQPLSRGTRAGSGRPPHGRQHAGEVLQHQALQQHQAELLEAAGGGAVPAGWEGTSNARQGQGGRAAAVQGRAPQHQAELLAAAAGRDTPSRWEGSSTAGQGSEEEEEEGSSEDGVALPDLLPELPYATGARRLPKRHARPIGIVT